MDKGGYRGVGSYLCTKLESKSVTGQLGIINLVNVWGPVFKHLFPMPMSDIFFENLCDCSRSSTSIALRIGSICSHELANVQLLFNNQYIFGTPCYFDDWKTAFCKISQSPQPTWLL